MSKSISIQEFEKNAAKEIVIISLIALAIVMFLVIWGYKIILGL